MFRGIKLAVFVIASTLIFTLISGCSLRRTPVPEPTSTPYPTYTPYQTYTPIVKPTATATVQATTYEVQAGDTLSQIAERFGVTVEAIAEANSISDPNLISVGQVLIIPTSIPPTTSAVTKTIKIAAFNIQIFGKSKRQKDHVMDILDRICREFDVMLVQEIRDAEEKTALYYLQRINEMEGPKYEYIRSERLGRTTSKEAYAYFYNTETVDFIEASDYVYDDAGDVFEREPYIASFRSGNFDFTLVGIHTKPSDADSEIGNLAVVVYSVRSENPNERDIIVMGDFNADGSYFDEDDVSNPFKASEFYWVITNNMDTMTKTDWTYD